MIAALSAQPAHTDTGAWLRLGLVALGLLVLNLPFGFWRAGLRRFGAAWFVAVHAPVPLAVGLRLAFGLRWNPVNVMALAAAFLAGQFLGGKFRARRRWADGAGPDGHGERARLS